MHNLVPVVKYFFCILYLDILERIVPKAVLPAKYDYIFMMKEGCIIIVKESQKKSCAKAVSRFQLQYGIGTLSNAPFFHWLKRAERIKVAKPVPVRHPIPESPLKDRSRLADEKNFYLI